MVYGGAIVCARQRPRTCGHGGGFAKLNFVTMYVTLQTRHHDRHYHTDY